jgi:hypothetical protein
MTAILMSLMDRSLVVLLRRGIATTGFRRKADGRLRSRPIRAGSVHIDRAIEYWSLTTNDGNAP